MYGLLVFRVKEEKTSDDKYVLGKRHSGHVSDGVCLSSLLFPFHPLHCKQKEDCVIIIQKGISM